jgi:hypothetical protein
MRGTRKSRRRWGVGLTAALMLGITGPVVAQAAPSPDREVERAAEDPPDGVDPASPSVVLPALLDDMRRLLAEPAPTDPHRRRGLAQAVVAGEQALVEYTDDSTDLRAVTEALATASRNLHTIRPRNDDDARELKRVNAGLVAVARRFAADLIGLATAARADARVLEAARSWMERGDARAAASDDHVAAAFYGEALTKVSSGIHFDLETFERKIREKIGPSVIGYAYTINSGGQLARSSAEGKARTAADAPETDQSPDKEQHLASVSKTIAGAAMLRVLQDKDISVDSALEPYLPAAWSRGFGISSITFRHLLTHRSGIVGGWGSEWESLKNRVALPWLAADFDYENANFGLMRILIPRIADPANAAYLDEQMFSDETNATIHAQLFEDYVIKTIFEPIGIFGRCRSSDPADTRYYNWPPDNQPGYVEPDRLLGCGGYGWFLSSNELGAFLAHLRYTNTLVSPTTRGMMDQYFLGWQNPADGYSWGEGVFGTYHSHGGTWDNTSGEARTCIMKFPIKVEVALVINSERNFNEHQCTVLKNAFETAWVT